MYSWPALAIWRIHWCVVLSFLFFEKKTYNVQYIYTQEDLE